MKVAPFIPEPMKLSEIVDSQTVQNTVVHNDWKNNKITDTMSFAHIYICDIDIIENIEYAIPCSMDLADTPKSIQTIADTLFERMFKCPFTGDMIDNPSSL